MTFKALIIDLEGVILDIDYAETFMEFAKNGIKVTYNKEFKTLVEDYDSGNITTEQSYQRFCDNYCQNNPIAKEKFTEAWNKMLLYIPDRNLEYLFQLKKQGITLVLLSNINELHAENVHKTYGELFEKLFDKILYSYQIHALKPAQEAFVLAMDFLKNKNIKKEEIIFIDDTSANIEAAVKLNLQAKKFPTNGMDKNKNVFLRSLLESHMPLTFFGKKSQQGKQIELQEENTEGLGLK